MVNYVNVRYKDFQDKQEIVKGIKEKLIVSFFLLKKVKFFFF